MPHCWTDTGHLKRKFCNVCRKRIEDNPALRCENCEYTVHAECQDFCNADCKECATYVPGQNLVSSRDSLFVCFWSSEREIENDFRSESLITKTPLTKRCVFPNVLQQKVFQRHHWREGNLPANSKCHHCKKTCWSSECLSGYRCEWCGWTVSIFEFFF